MTNKSKTLYILLYICYTVNIFFPHLLNKPRLVERAHLIQFSNILLYYTLLFIIDFDLKYIIKLRAEISNIILIPHIDYHLVIFLLSVENILCLIDLN